MSSIPIQGRYGTPHWWGDEHDGSLDENRRPQSATSEQKSARYWDAEHHEKERLWIVGERESKSDEIYKSQKSRNSLKDSKFTDDECQTIKERLKRSIKKIERTKRRRKEKKKSQQEQEALREAELERAKKPPWSAAGGPSMYSSCRVAELSATPMERKYSSPLTKQMKKNLKRHGRYVRDPYQNYNYER
eukprot:g4588.t1